MFYERSHWISLIFGIGAIYLWTLFGIYGTVGIIGIIIALIVGGIVGRMVWEGANYITNDWFDDTKVIPGVFIGLFAGVLVGGILDASELVPGSFLYTVIAGPLLSIPVGLRMDASQKRRWAAERDRHERDAERYYAQKKTSFRAYLIDPLGRTIEEIDCDGSLPAIQGLVDARSVEGASLGGGDIVYVDSMGRHKEGLCAFRFEPRPQPLRGKGLLIGSDHGGECADARIGLDEVQRQVAWLGPLDPE